MIRRRRPLPRPSKPLKRTAIRRSEKPIPRESAKHRQSQTELHALVPALIARSGGRCEVRFSTRCTGWGTDPHHVVKRSQRSGHDLALLLWSCRPCNDAVELDPDGARAAGVSLKSWEVPNI